MNDTEINDKRSSAEFKGITFSNFKNSELSSKKEFLKFINELEKK